MKRAVCVVVGWVLVVGAVRSAEEPKGGLPAAGGSPYERLYGDYKPDFLEKPLFEGGKSGASADQMKLSSEESFYTLNLISESSRAYALVEAAKQKETEGIYREAMEIYQKVVDEHPEELFRVSRHGVFVPIAHYAQLRILAFPAEHLQLYRTRHDARAREAFEMARRNNSLEGLANVRDTLLATSYGAKALMMLGAVALDRGHFLEALEYYTTVRDGFPDAEARAPETGLAIAYCLKMLGEPGAPERTGKTEPPSGLSPEELKALRQYVSQSRVEAPAAFEQMASAPNVTLDDYRQMPPTDDPLGLKPPVWSVALPGSKLDFHIYSHPVITSDSLLYRHKNVVYSRSLITGNLRWINDLGGRVTWQNWGERQYPLEDLLVQDGRVFTAMHKVGPTLVALDEITGELRWAYGPMTATTREEANMRFEAAPAGGPMTVYAGYVLDNIEGATHTDTEYGVMAFESLTGRVRWRKPLCRLRPGRFTAGVSQRRRNRIRSFSSPPLYNEGTIYFSTDAGVVAALDALSGRVKWLMRYPYYTHPDPVHDASRRFGDGGRAEPYTDRFGPGGVRVTPHNPMFWYGQRPLLIGEGLYVLPIDSKFMYKLDRRTGKVLWTFNKPGGTSHLLGPLPGGELVLANSGMGGRTDKNGPSVLIDPATGRVTQRLEDGVAREPQPTVNMSYGIGGTSYPVSFGGLGHDRANYQITGRPFMSRTGQLIVGSFAYWGYNTFGYGANLAVYSMNDDQRPVTARRRYFSGQLIAVTENAREKAPVWLKHVEALPVRNERVENEIEMLKSYINDTQVANEQPPFIPFTRMTVERNGVLFELRFGPRTVSMVYDKEALKRTLAGKPDSGSLFDRAELAIGEGLMDEAVGLMGTCLDRLPSEDVDFRTLINQQLYQVHKRLARGSVRARDPEKELTHCLGMNRTATTLGNELEVRFAIADAYARKGDHLSAGRQLQSVVATFADYKFPVSSLANADRANLEKTAGGILKQARGFADGTSHGAALSQGAAALVGAVPLYSGALSPLEPDLTVQAGEWAAAGLEHFRRLSPPLAEEMEKSAEKAMGAAGADAMARLVEFPGTRAAQKALDGLLKEADRGLAGSGDNMSDAAAWRRRLWRLADAARAASLNLPPAYAARLGAPARAAAAPLKFPMVDRTAAFDEERGPAWLVLERRGQMDLEPNLVFLGGRVKTKFDNKFLLYAIEAGSGEVRWKAREPRAGTWFDEIRLDGVGDEPGFFTAVVHDDVVVVHGRYDVLAFHLKDGRLKWRYRVPFTFEIEHAEVTGDLLALAGQSETVVLHLGTSDPRGEVVWQESEEGALYAPPYFHADRWVSVRKLPFNVTVRHRSTGRLIGRLSLPDLLLLEEHPLLEDGPSEVPFAHDGARLVLSDGWYYIMMDVERLRVVWKRLIDANDPTRLPALRLALKGEHLAVVKRDFDANAIHMLDSRTGNIVWRTDLKDSKSPRPIHSMLIEAGKLYGIRPHAGQGFYLVGMDCRDGKNLFAPNEQKEYGGKPSVRMRPVLHGSGVVVEVRDRQDFELKAFDTGNGRLQHTVRVKASGDFGEHGRASATVQNGSLALMGGSELVLAITK